MYRSHFLETLWHESYMPVFLERYVLPILVTLTVGVCVFNPWKWDWNQRISFLLRARAKQLARENPGRPAFDWEEIKKLRDEGRP